MRLWHQTLIPYLPRQQLLGQHWECCALRGGGWGKKHATVQYVFKYSPYKLFHYHYLVIDEMARRGYQVTPAWRFATYRGKTLPPYPTMTCHRSTPPTPFIQNMMQTTCKPAWSTYVIRGLTYPYHKRNKIGSNTYPDRSYIDDWDSS